MERSRWASTLHLDHCARVCIAIKLAPYSQFGLVRTPLSFGIKSGERPEYGPKKTRF